MTYQDTEDAKEEFYKKWEKQYSFHFKSTGSHGSYIEKIRNNILTICTGPAGTGKSMVAVKFAWDELNKGNIDKIIFTRPAVEADRGIGFLPGTHLEKISPWITPLDDILHTVGDAKLIKTYQSIGKIISKPVGFLRGTSMHNCICIADEFQNADAKLFKLLLTRVGKNSKMIITGDTKQSDIKNSGLEDAVKRLKGLDDVAIHQFTVEDVMRSPFVKAVLSRYEEESF